MFGRISVCKVKCLDKSLIEIDLEQTNNEHTNQITRNKTEEDNKEDNKDTNEEPTKNNVFLQIIKMHLSK